MIGDQYCQTVYRFIGIGAREVGNPAKPTVLNPCNQLRERILGGKSLILVGSVKCFLRQHQYLTSQAHERVPQEQPIGISRTVRIQLLLVTVDIDAAQAAGDFRAAGYCLRSLSSRGRQQPPQVQSGGRTVAQTSFGILAWVAWPIFGTCVGNNTLPNTPTSSEFDSLPLRLIL